MRSSALLPPLAALRAFEAVGRLLSFRRAGEELLITQSAVSHHIRALEAALGVRLFERRARSIALTPAGARYLEAVGAAFALIREGTAELTRPLLRVSVLPSFAANWLVPRLPQFEAQHPGIAVELEPTLALVDLAAGEADLAIRYGEGPWPGGRAELLVAEALTPVLSPALQARQPVATPQDLLGHTLLLSRRPIDWEAWAAAAGIDLGRARRVQLTDYNIVLQAALDGQGVALGRSWLIEDRLRAGALIAPCPLSVTRAQFGHWLLLPADRRPAPAAAAFAAWLKRVAAGQ